MLKPQWKTSFNRISKWSLFMIIAAMITTLIGNSYVHADRDKKEHKQEEHSIKSSNYEEDEDDEDDEDDEYENEGFSNQEQNPAQDQSTNIVVDKEQAIQLKLADLNESLTIQPVYYQGVLLVPAKDLMDYLNTPNIQYKKSGILELYADNKHLIFHINKPLVYQDSNKLSLSSPPIMQNGTYYLPLEPVLDRLGFNTAWNPQQFTLLIKRRG